MDVYLIIGQRKNRYPGEYAPEVITAIDYPTLDEQPDIIQTNLKYWRKTDEFVSVEVIKVNISDDYVDRKLDILPQDTAPSVVIPEAE